MFFFSKIADLQSLNGLIRRAKRSQKKAGFVGFCQFLGGFLRVGFLVWVHFIFPPGPRVWQLPQRAIPNWRPCVASFLYLLTIWPMFFFAFPPILLSYWKVLKILKLSIVTAIWGPTVSHHNALLRMFPKMEKHIQNPNMTPPCSYCTISSTLICHWHIKAPHKQIMAATGTFPTGTVSFSQCTL